jgi:hypothetical protein
MTKFTTKTCRTVSRLDRCYSELHGRWVRLNKVEADGFVEVCDSETLVVMPDLCHPTQIQ